MKTSFFRKKIAIFLSFAFIWVSVGPMPQAEAATVPITAQSALLLDQSTGKTIFSRSPHKKRAPASTTKILTAILAVERLDLKHVVTVPGFVTSIEPSKIYMKPGEKYYVRDLVKAILTNSANDAAEVLAHEIGGSRANFSKIMNKRVRQLGGKNSNFIRASGLPAKGQYSTAYDMALIMKKAREYPFLVQTMKMKTGVIYSRGGRKIYLKNHNKMLWRDSREIIGKTGWTRRAKHCFVGQVNVYRKKVFISILGSNSLWRDVKRLVDFRFGSSYRVIKTNQKLWSTAETKKIQLALKNSGYSPGSIDGKFGPRTIKAVKGFQKIKGLGVDGIVGNKTWAQLKKYL